MTEDDLVRYTKEEGIATITINRRNGKGDNGGRLPC